jgi:hypothetical protein
MSVEVIDYEGVMPFRGSEGGGLVNEQTNRGDGDEALPGDLLTVRLSPWLPSGSALRVVMLAVSPRRKMGAGWAGITALCTRARDATQS